MSGVAAPRPHDVRWETGPYPRGRDADPAARYLVHDLEVGLAVGAYADPDGDRDLLVVANDLTGGCHHPNGNPVYLRYVERWALLAPPA